MRLSSVFLTLLWAHWQTNIYIVKINPYTWAIKCLHFYINLYRSRADYTYDFAVVATCLFLFIFFFLHSSTNLHATDWLYIITGESDEIMFWRILYTFHYFLINSRTPFVFDFISAFAVRRSYASSRFDAKRFRTQKRHSRRRRRRKNITRNYGKKILEIRKNDNNKREKNGMNFLPPLVCWSHEPCSV